MSTTPAFSPMPTSRCSFMASVVLSPNWRRWFLLDLYEQCSDHMTEYMASSAAVGRRPRMSRMRWYSSGFRPSSANGCSWSGVAAATSTVSVWGARAGAVVIDSLGGDPWGRRGPGGPTARPTSADAHRIPARGRPPEHRPRSGRHRDVTDDGYVSD